MEKTHINEVTNWLNNLSQLEVNQNCPAPNFLKPFHLAMLTHRLRLRKLKNLDLSEKIQTYANTMNLWECLSIPPPGQIQSRKPAGRYYPLQLLKDRSVIEDVAEQLAVLLRPVCCNATTIDAVDTMMRELIDNCFSHSAVDDGVYGVICAQVWGGGRKAQIAIADTGVGIRESLLDNLCLMEQLQEGNSCELATQFGVSGKIGKGHSGYGLALARGLIEQNDGTLIVISQNEVFFLQGNSTRSFELMQPWHGTLLIIEWNLDMPMDLGPLYKSFPLPEGMTDDDFDF